MLTLDFKSRTPVYQQIMGGIKHLILAGILAPGEQLPSVRAFAQDLGVNVNTVAKAYSLLEAQGCILSLPGRGNFVCEDLSVLKEEQKEKSLQTLEQVLREACKLGISREDVCRRVESIWGKEEA